MPKRIPAVGDLVMCEWRDAFANAKEEHTQDEVNVQVSYKFKTYGILARNDMGRDISDPIVAVAAEVGDDNRYRGVTYIPAQMVVDLELVRAKKKPRKSQVKHENPPSLPAPTL